MFLSAEPRGSFVEEDETFFVIVFTDPLEGVFHEGVFHEVHRNAFERAP